MKLELLLKGTEVSLRTPDGAYLKLIGSRAQVILVGSADVHTVDEVRHKLQAATGKVWHLEKGEELPAFLEDEDGGLSIREFRRIRDRGYFNLIFKEQT